MGIALRLNLSRFKASEALLGIETNYLKDQEQEKLRFKASEALLGIETTTYIYT